MGHKSINGSNPKKALSWYCLQWVQFFRVKPSDFQKFSLFIHNFLFHPNGSFSGMEIISYSRFYRLFCQIGFMAVKPTRFK